MHGDHRGSLSLVTKSDGNELGRVWHDPFGEIISHTLPLTLTDRLFTGGRRESTIGAYGDLGQWYDPHTGRYLSPLGGQGNPYLPCGIFDPSVMFVAPLAVWGLAFRKNRRRRAGRRWWHWVVLGG